MIKEVFLPTGNFICEIVEDGDKYQIKNPVTLVSVPSPDGKMATTFMPLSVLNPIVDLKVPKDHVYSINDLPLDVIKSYKDFITNLKLELSKVNTSTSKISADIKKIN